MLEETPRRFLHAWCEAIIFDKALNKHRDDGPSRGEEMVAPSAPGQQQGCSRVLALSDPWCSESPSASPPYSRRSTCRWSGASIRVPSDIFERELECKSPQTRSLRGYIKTEERLDSLPESAKRDEPPSTPPP
ncbi:hypothetical protein J6590_002752 [Homalodisca vitripennis]|nr:hypothetical protein J6590_002752 [Homalodisca vitripennis]